MRKKLLILFLILALFINPLRIIATHQSTYFSKGYSQRYEALKNKYYSSQYANKHYTKAIADEELESFAGGAFRRGTNPILIHHDQPPLGRYIIALSILLFDNERTIPLILLLVSAVGIYLVALQVIKNVFFALIPFGIFINQPMFINKLFYIPLLEPMQFPFILFALYAFIKGVRNKKYLPWFIATALCIGFVISIRYFVLGAALTGSLLLYLLLKKDMRRLFTLSLALPLSLFVLLYSYFQTFRDGYSLIKVLGIQKYIFVYHKSAFVQPFSYWDLLLFNRWHTWWGNNAILSDAEWSILWPLSFIIILLFLIFTVWKKYHLDPAEIVLLLWVGIYSVMLSFGYTSTRYFLPMVPFLYILATAFVIKFIKHIKNLHKKTLK